MANPPGYSHLKNKDLESQNEGETTFEISSGATQDICDQKYTVQIFGREEVFIFQFNPNDGFRMFCEYINFRLRDLGLEKEYFNYRIGYFHSCLVDISSDLDFRDGRFSLCLIIYRESDISDIEESIYRTRRKYKERIKNVVTVLLILFCIVVFLYMFIGIR